MSDEDAETYKKMKELAKGVKVYVQKPVILKGSQWTSGVEDSADQTIALYYPKDSVPMGEAFLRVLKTRKEVQNGRPAERPAEE
jgi:hypothetical protein